MSLGYTVRNVRVTKEMKINLGNYETAGLVIGIDAEPESPITTKEELLNFSNKVSEDVNSILSPQVKAVKDWAKSRYEQK